VDTPFESICVESCDFFFVAVLGGHSSNPLAAIQWNCRNFTRPAASSLFTFRCFCRIAEEDGESTPIPTI
jgi:hypothetical protein